MNKKNLLAVTAAAACVALSGCATIVSSTHEDVRITTNNAEVGDKLNPVVNMKVTHDKGTRIEEIHGNQTIKIKRNSDPYTVEIVESECILPSTIQSKPGYLNPAVFLDFLATSLLSTSIDCSTGAAWKYDEVMTVEPNIKDTPECKAWLESLK